MTPLTVSFQTAKGFHQQSLFQHDHLRCELLLEELRKCCNAGWQALVRRIVECQPEFLWRPSGQDLHKPAASYVLRNMETGQHRNTRTVRGHVGEDLAIVGAERSSGRNGDARSAV